MVTWQHEKKSDNLDWFILEVFKREKGLYAIVEAYKAQVCADNASNHTFHGREGLSEKVIKEHHNWQCFSWLNSSDLTSDQYKGMGHFSGWNLNGQRSFRGSTKNILETLNTAVWVN